jgi:hypothetical protein
MAIRVVCANCTSKFDVRDDLAGRYGPCPKCKRRIDIPADAIAEAPKARWSVRASASAPQRGPVSGDVMRLWIANGLIKNSEVLREGWTAWRPAEEIFPSLKERESDRKAMSENSGQSKKNTKLVAGRTRHRIGNLVFETPAEWQRTYMTHANRNGSIGNSILLKADATSQLHITADSRFVNINELNDLGVTRIPLCRTFAI